jgi:hypothetical protein
MATVEQVRAVALSLPRAYEALVRDRVKFRVGQIVFAALSRDERALGFGYPREERAALVESRPDTFFMPSKGDLRYQWVECWLDRLDEAEMAELITDAWRMCVPKRVAASVARADRTRPSRTPLTKPADGDQAD